jgi:chloride channel protein, CIC family
MNALWPGHTSAYFAYAMVGMGAFMVGVTQASLMTILLLFEMTLSYQVVLPLMVLCVVAYVVARATGTVSMYEVTLRHRQDAQERLRIRTMQMRELIQPAQTVVPITASVADMTRVFLEYPVTYRTCSALAEFPASDAGQPDRLPAARPPARSASPLAVSSKRIRGV